MLKYAYYCRTRDVLKKSKKIVVHWNMEESKPQISSVVEFTKGSISLESDQAPFMGGGGRAPDPIQYCLFGTAACFAATFASVAAEKGVEADSLIVSAENHINLGQSVGLSEEPIVEGVKITAEVKSNMPKEKIDEVLNLSLKRCPGIYCITKPIPLETSLKIS
ncbi:MAG: OsmC family protein [Nitrospirota bacterium]